MRFRRLPRHITGFARSNDDPPSVNPTFFKRACHTVAQHANARISAFATDESSRSFFTAIIEVSDSQYSILGNAVYPVIAFSKAASSRNEPPAFLDVVKLSRLFSELTEFHVLDAAWLNGDAEAEMMDELQAVEIDQIAYWKPTRVGDVIFNHWD